MLYLFMCGVCGFCRLWGFSERFVLGKLFVLVMRISLVYVRVFFVYVLIILGERYVMDFIVGISFCAVGLFVCCVCCIHMCYICFF